MEGMALASPSSGRIQVVDLSSDSDEDKQPTPSRRGSSNRGTRLQEALTNGAAHHASSSALTASTSAHANVVPAPAAMAEAVRPRTRPSSKSKVVVCHHHKQRCPDEMLQCTVQLPTGQRCPLMFCGASLDKVYGTSLGYLLTRGLDQQFMEGKTHVTEEIDYIWACPRCMDRCGCVMCKFRTHYASSEQDASSSSLASSPVPPSIVQTASPRTPSMHAPSAQPAASSVARPMSRPNVPPLSALSLSRTASRPEAGTSSPKVTSAPSFLTQFEKRDLPPPRFKQSNLLQGFAEAAKMSGSSSSSSSTSSSPHAHHGAAVTATSWAQPSAWTSRPSASSVAPMFASPFGQPSASSLAQTPHDTSDNHGNQPSVAPPPPPKVKPAFRRKALVAPDEVVKPQLDRVHTSLPVANVMERIWIYETLVRFDIIGMPKGEVLRKLERFDDWTATMLHTILIRLACFLGQVKSHRTGPLPQHKGPYRTLIQTLRFHDRDTHAGEVWQSAERLIEAKEGTIRALEDVVLSDEQDVTMADDSHSDNPHNTLLARRNTRSRRDASKAAHDKVRQAARNEQDSSLEEGEVEEGEVSSDQMDLDGDGSEGARATDVEEASTPPSEDEDAPPRRATKKTKRAATQKQGNMRVAIRQALGLRPRTGQADDVGNDLSTSERPAPDVIVLDDDQDEVQSEISGSSSTHAVSTASRPALPSFERRVAILSALVDLTLQRDDIRDEIRNGEVAVEEYLQKYDQEKVEETQKWTKEATELERKQFHASQTGQANEWREELRKLERDRDLHFIDLDVAKLVFVDANKSKSGPIGVDIDGNAYWQLSEYNETRPDNVAGHWAWRLLILGTPKTVPRQTSEEDDAIPAEGESQRAFWATNDEKEIGNLIAYIRYRTKRLCHLEEKEMQDRLQRVEEQGPSDPDTIRALNDDYTQMRSQHKAYRSQTNRLCDGLQEYQKYYRWQSWDEEDEEEE